ncbi:unnamed protein product [Adineta steineri]|uniref:NAD(P)(+)--arginine ADP-ribosyltransferase n=1 Tax=Adineta steineri TaxID=433720 RepID=A0A819AHG6_9BILA|nr:unnamed protein product [Adineta steineri]CAF1250832.1 unnamed protein product [Adineta steineri]CAF3767065.1 unnamed protein product [Adineta steineri]CAF3783827.1 unnamed protein product [Adineta steineri]
MGAQKSKQKLITTSKSTASSNIRQSRRHMAQNYLLVWVDASIDQANKDYKKTLTQLNNVVNDVNICIKPSQCIQLLSQIDNERAFVITSGSLGQHLVPEIHGMPQLDAIYILCGNKCRHQGWAQNWTKIKGVHTNIKEICHALQLAIKQCDQDAIAVSFLTMNEMASTHNLNQLEPNFMYTQILKDILLNMKHNEEAIKYFITYCRRHDCVSSININRFEKEYHAQLAVWWYTFPSNIYSILNNALRTLDADAIITMGFFLSDLHQQIQQLYEQQFSAYGGESFVVYRGQGIMRADFEKLQKTKGGLMSFNNFLSTSKDKEVSLEYAECASTKPDTVGILFIMFIDPCLKSTPFASIKGMSYFKGEEEILFSMHTVFRVGSVKQIDNKNTLYQVELQLTSDDDQQLRTLTDWIREEASGTGWKRLGELLLQIGQFKKAEDVYCVLLEQACDEDERTLYYNQLGLVHANQGDNEKAIWYYEQKLEIQQKTIPSNHPSLATSYNNIGGVFGSMGEYSKALSFYEKALEIRQKTLPSDQPLLAISYNNIGSMYNNMGEYSKALSFYERALEIRKNTLPSNHPSLATSYNNIGLLYSNLGEYSEALSSHEKALDIQQKSLPSNHSSLAASYNNIGTVYDKMGEYSKALSSHEKALEIQQKTLPSNHPHLATSYNNIGLVYEEMGKYLKALSSHEKALEIQQKNLASNHPLLATSYNNIGIAYNSMEQYSKALSSHEKALEIRQKTLPLNHPDLATSYSNIACVYYDRKDYSRALSFYEKALEIQQKALHSNHPSLSTSYNNIGGVYNNMGEYSKALSSHEKALEIREKTYPSNHPDLATSYNNSGIVYYNMKDYSKALSFFEKALVIYQNKLSPNHSSLATLYNNIGFVYKNMKDYSKALSYLECALDIRQRALPPTHPDIKVVKETIEIVKEEMKNIL